MTGPDLPALEARLLELLTRYDELERQRPRLPCPVERAQAGREIDAMLAEIGEVQKAIITAQAKSLADAAVQLWRLAVYIDPVDQVPARLLASTTAAVERATQKSA